MKIETGALNHPRLALTWPATWISRPVDRHLFELVVDERVTIRVRPQLALPADYQFWIDRTMREDLPGDLTIVPHEFQHGISAHGWPIVIAHCEARTASGELVEDRFGVFYRILHDGAEVVARLRGTSWPERAADLRPVLLGATVVWPAPDAAHLFGLLGMDR